MIGKFTSWIDRSAAIVVIVTAIATAVNARTWLSLPATVGGHERRLQEIERLHVSENLRVIRAQNDWFVRVLAKKLGVEAPDFSRFDPATEGETDARRN